MGNGYPGTSLQLYSFVDLVILVHITPQLCTVQCEVQTGVLRSLLYIVGLLDAYTVALSHETENSC